MLEWEGLWEACTSMSVGGSGLQSNPVKTASELSFVEQEVHTIFHYEFENTYLTSSSNEFMVW